MKFLLLPFLAAVLAASSFSQATAEIKVINKPDPKFPAEAIDPLYGSEIKVAVTVDKKGNVSDARSNGPLAPCSNLKDPIAKSIRQAAIDAAKETTFEPILKDGKPAEKDLMITYPLRPRTKPISDDEKKIIQAGVVSGKALSLPRPAYPAGARPLNLSGPATVQILIGDDGSVLSVAPVRGHELLLESAIEAACKARFAPTTLSGQLVKVSGTVTYNFVR